MLFRKIINLDENKLFKFNKLIKIEIVQRKKDLVKIANKTSNKKSHTQVKKKIVVK